MRERHIDGTVLMRQAASGVFEPLARPDLLITDADRANVTTSRRKDRDAALIGKLNPTHYRPNIFDTHLPRHHFCDLVFPFFAPSALRLEHEST
jgi:hypothetical protein